jgi:hypothetical protein
MEHMWTYQICCADKGLVSANFPKPIRIKRRKQGFIPLDLVCATSVFHLANRLGPTLFSCGPTAWTQAARQCGTTIGEGEAGISPEKGLLEVWNLLKFYWFYSFETWKGFHSHMCSTVYTIIYNILILPTLHNLPLFWVAGDACLEQRTT